MLSAWIAKSVTISYAAAAIGGGMSSENKHGDEKSLGGPSELRVMRDLVTAQIPSTSREWFKWLSSEESKTVAAYRRQTGASNRRLLSRESYCA